MDYVGLWVGGSLTTRPSVTTTLAKGGAWAPVLPGAPSLPGCACPPGIEVRFRALVKQIKAHANYTEAIGMILGIEGAVQVSPR